MTYEFYASPELERAALRRATARASCDVRALHMKRRPAEVRSTLVCVDGWAAARLLLALAIEDADTPGARKLALELRGSLDDEGFARAIQAFVKERVRFSPEEGEIFQSGAWTLNHGYGDCDDHFRLAFALARAGGLRAALGLLHHGDDAPPELQGPAHAALLVGELGAGDGRWVWAETTVDAGFGENPNDAATRLGLQNERTDIAREVKIMTEESDLPPVPQGYVQRNDPGQVLLDGQALQALGFIAEDVPRCAFADPTSTPLRVGVLAFQRAQGLTADGLLGPKTRAAIAAALRAAGSSFDYTVHIGQLGDVTGSASSDLTDDFLQAVIAMVARFRVGGAKASAEDFFLVWSAESGIRNIPNAQGAPFGGINQMGPQERQSAGFKGTFAEWLALPLIEQLPFVERYYVGATGGHFDRMLDAPALYLLNFAPAFSAHAAEPDFVLFRRDPQSPDPGAGEDQWKPWRDAHKGDAYAWNRGFDRRRDGTIRVGDLAVALSGVAKSARFLDVQKRVRAMGGGSSSSASSGAVVVGTVLATLAALGGLAWWTFRT